MVSARSLRLPLWLALLPCLLPAARLCAQGGPPFLTDDPGTPAAQRWEVNTAWAYERRPGSCLQSAPLLDLGYGLSDRLQLSYVVAHVVGHEDGSHLRLGLSNSQAGLKWRFFEDSAAGLSLSVAPQLEFRNPGSNSPVRGLASDEITLVLPVEGQWIAGDWSLTTELGAIRPSRSDSGWLYGLLLGRTLSPRVEAGLEFHGEGDEHLARTQLAANVGVRLKLDERFRLLASVGTELHNQLAPRSTVLSYVGIQWTP